MPKHYSKNELKADLDRLLKNRESWSKKQKGFDEVNYWVEQDRAMLYGVFLAADNGLFEEAARRIRRLPAEISNHVPARLKKFCLTGK